MLKESTKTVVTNTQHKTIERASLAKEINTKVVCFCVYVNLWKDYQYILT